MLQINNKVAIPLSEIELQAVRAQGAGGQHVNKVATAIHLRFDIAASSLPDHYKARLLRHKDHRITQDGVVVLKAQQHRSQTQNKEEALQRLRALIKTAIKPRKKRKPTKPTRGSKERRLNKKKKHGQKKALRGRIKGSD